MHAAIRNDQLRMCDLSSRDCLKLVYDKNDPSATPHASSLFLVGVLVLVLFMGLCSLVLDNMHARKVVAQLDEAPHALVKVIEGDTLWDIAMKNHCEGLRTQEIVDWIYAYNHLESSALKPGQRIVVPTILVR